MNDERGMEVKKKKRNKQSRVVDTIISFVFATGVTYGLVSLLQSYQNGSTFFENFIAYSDKYSWIMAQDMTYKSPLLVLFFSIFIGLTVLTKKKTVGYRDASTHGAYGNAQFSTVEDVRESGFIAERNESKWSEKDPLKSLGVKEGIILGSSKDELFIIPPETELDNRNVLVVGSSGSSKGQAFVINNIINNRSQSIIVTDPKGELFKLTSDVKKDQGYRIEQVDFLNLRGSRYNPLDYVTNDIEAIKISNAISLNSAKDIKQDFFFNTARDLLTGLIIYVKAEHDEPNISRTVKGIFNQISEDEEFLPNLAMEIGVEHPAYQYFKDASAATGNTRTSILQSFAQQTGIFSLTDVARLTEKSDFSFHDLQEERTILYVKIPVKDNPVPALTATFFDQLISTLYQIGDANGAVLNIPTIFLFDEFANLGKLNDFDNTLSTCRGYGMSIMTIVQDFAQLEEKYSEKLARTIINNHDTTLFLRTKDTKTAEYFSKLAGDTTINFKTKSSSNNGGLLYLLGVGSSNPSRSESEQYVKKPLISESELLQMDRHKCYVFITGHVIELEKAYQSKIYKGFLTKEVFENGSRRFPYVYPENRKAYIQKFNFTPYEKKRMPSPEQDMGVIETVNPQVEPIEHSIQEENTVSEQIESEVGSKDKAIDSIVSSFFLEIEKKNSKKEGANKKNSIEETTSHDVALSESVELSRIIVEDLQQTFDESDPAELQLLKDISMIPDVIEKTNSNLEEIYQLNNVVVNLQLTDDAEENVETKSDEEFEDVTDELPM